jgi:aminoglycoside phosphotransferase (APT) family kinase protein
VLAAIGRFGFDDPGFEPTAQLSAYLAGKVGAGHERLLAAAAAAEPLLATVAGARQLLHSDFNPKNILVRDSAVVAVLDWEFAFAGTPLFDIGNMLRFSDGYPPAYVDGFVAGFRAGGGHLPARWREITEALDLFALADFLARPESPYHDRAVAVAERFTAKAL